MHCRGTQPDGQRCPRPTQANDEHCSEHQPVNEQQQRRGRRARSVSFPSLSPQRSSSQRSRSARPNILTTFSIEELHREIMRRIPVRMWSASAAASSSVEDEQDPNGDGDLDYNYD
ncbi:hypothetical protein SLS57_011331 [Botryosphaeria dothidea]